MHDFIKSISHAEDTTHIIYLGKSSHNLGNFKVHIKYVDANDWVICIGLWDMIYMEIIWCDYGRYD